MNYRIYDRDLLIHHHTPVDDIEPEYANPQDLREAALKYVGIMNSFANLVENGLRDRDMRNVATKFWGAAYALGLGCCDGVSMTARAHSLGVTRAAISKTARVLCEANNLPPSWYLKQETDAYMHARNAQVAASNGSSNGTSE